MSFDPSEPRDKDGKWAGGSARGHNAGINRSLVDRISTQHQRDVAYEIGKGALLGVAEGVALGVAVGAVTGGVGGIAALAGPVNILRSAAFGAAKGAKEAVQPHAVAAAVVVGGYTSYQTHRAAIKTQIVKQHKMESKK